MRLDDWSWLRDSGDSFGTEPDGSLWCDCLQYKRCVYNLYCIKYILVNWSSVLHDMHFHRNESSCILILDPVGAASTLGYCNVVQLQQARKRGAEKCKSMFLNSTQPYSSWLKPIAKIQEAIAWTQLSVLQAILTFLSLGSAWYFRPALKNHSIRLDQVPRRHDNRRVHCHWDRVQDALGRALHSHWPSSKFVERRCHWQRGHWSTSKPAGICWALGCVMYPNVLPMAMQNRWISGLSLQNMTKSSAVAIQALDRRMPQVYLHLTLDTIRDH